MKIRSWKKLQEAGPKISAATGVKESKKGFVELRTMLASVRESATFVPPSASIYANTNNTR